MPKKPRVRALMDSQQVKGSETLLKSARRYFCHIFLSFWKKISSKNSFLVVPEILRLFVNILTPDDKYSLLVKASVWRNKLKWNYLQIEKYFVTFFLHFQKLHKMWNTFKQQMSHQYDLFLNFKKFKLKFNCKKRGYLNEQKTPCQNTYGHSIC